MKRINSVANYFIIQLVENYVKMQFINSVRLESF